MSQERGKLRKGRQGNCLTLSGRWKNNNNDGTLPQDNNSNGNKRRRNRWIL